MDKDLAKGYNLLNMISSEDGKLMVGKARMILFSARGYVYLVRSIYRQSPQALKFILYDVGYQIGEELMSTLREMTSDLESLMIYAIETFKQAGYGDFELVEFDLQKPYMRVRGRNLFEASLAPETGVYRTPRTVDHWSRGMFAGFFSQMLGTEVVCEEMACQSKGDEASEFVIMPFTAGSEDTAK